MPLLPCSFPQCSYKGSSPRALASHAGRTHKRVEPHHQAFVQQSFLTPQANNLHVSSDIDNQNNANETFNDTTPTQGELTNGEGEVVENLRIDYAPFTHAQWWILDWMMKALVSQTMQTKFYMDTRIYGFGFEDTDIRRFKDAERLIHKYLMPLRFSSANLEVFGTNYLMYFRDMQEIITKFVQRVDLKDDIVYQWECLRNENGGKRKKVTLFDNIWQYLAIFDNVCTRYEHEITNIAKNWQT